MSRIGKKKIEIPAGTEVSINGATFSVKGKEGELIRTFNNIIEIKKEDNQISVNPKDESKFARAMWGTVASHIKNMIEGVNQKFVKNLIIEGVGYRATVSGKKITLSVGFSHDVILDIIDGVDVEVEKDNFKVSGIDKEKVGLMASKIRVVKKPEPYKGKGIRYADEIIKRKEGKKSV